jgi:arylsulfatase A-like enzyme
MVIGEGLGAPGPMYYGSLDASPFGDALLLDFAQAAIEGESLGQDDAADILVLSLSGHDYVNHSWGAESRLSHDHVLQVDQLLAAFFRALDRKIGGDNYVAVLTADHGLMPVPEHLISQGREAGRLNPRGVLAILEEGLARSFGAGPWVRGWSAQAILLDRARIASRGVDARAIGDEAKRILLAQSGVAAAYTRTEILGTGFGDGSGEPSPRPVPGDPLLDAVRKGWHRERSADVQVVLKPGWMLSSYRFGTTHGSPHAYDTHVPMLFYGPRWVKPGRIDERAEVADIAPTLAAMLGVAVPSSSEGRPLALRP